jgi:hypothetical protein
MIAEPNTRKTDYILLSIGILLVLIPLVVVLAAPRNLNSLQLFLRIVAALGGAMVGAAIPGVLEINIPGVRAAGALGVLVLLLLFDPTSKAGKGVDDDEVDPSQPPKPQPCDVTFNGKWSGNATVLPPSVM